MLRLAVRGPAVVGPIRRPWRWSALVSRCRAGLPPLVCCAVPPRCSAWVPLSPSCCLDPGRGVCAAADPCLTRYCGRRSLSRCPRRRALGRCPFFLLCRSRVRRRALGLCTHYPRCCPFVRRRAPSAACWPVNLPELALIWHCPLLPVVLDRFQEVRSPQRAHRCIDSLAPSP